MKPANGFGLALAAAAMVAAMAQTAAASGSIRSITTCDPETGHREYGPNDPVRIGEALAFKVRLLNFNTNCTSTGGTDNPWRFRPRPGVDEALAAANPPAMGLWIGGRKRCATIRSVQPSLSYYTDLVFEYVVQSGDQAQPVRFCNVDGSGPLADSAGQLYPLENVGPGSCWVLTDEATGTSCEFSFGSEALVPSSNDGFAYPPAGWSASGEVRDYDLSRAGIYVNGFKDIAATVTGCAVPYDGQGHGVTVAVSDPDDGAALRFARGTLSGPTDAWSETAPMFTNACDATVWVEIAAEGYATVTNHADVTITNAPLTIAAKDQAYAYNGQTQGEGDTAYATPGDLAEKVAVSGLAPGDGLASIILDGQATDPGTYPLVPSDATVTNAVGANVTDNYAIGYTNGTLTIREPLPFVSNVVARQRWPWNGLVDVDYEVGGTTTGLVTRISFAEQGGAGRSWVATNFLAGAEPSVEPGFHRATWDTAADGATNVVAAEVVATVTLVAPPYIVRFNANGGVGGSADQRKKRGETFRLNRNPFQRTDFLYMAWNTAADGSGVYYVDRQEVIDIAPPGGTVTLYACWVKPDYAIRFDANGGVGDMADQTATRGVSTKLNKLAFTRENACFTGWNTKPDGTGVAIEPSGYVTNPAPYVEGSTLSFTDEVTLYAQWRSVTAWFRIDFESNGGTWLPGHGLSITEDYQWIDLNQFTKLRPVPYGREGFRFAGWNTKPDGTGVPYEDQEEVYNVSGDYDTPDLYAQWELVDP